MIGYSDIVGHRQIIEQLKKAASFDKVSHAYIFNGPKDSGKMMLAESFAMALQCEERDPCGCGVCRSCRQAQGHNQPDIIYTTHEKNLYSAEEIREQLVNDMEIKPYSSRYKIYIVDEAEKLSPVCQNIILKTIEEPPAYGIVMLLTTNADSFLQTIRSRCVQMDLKAVPSAEIREYLMTKHRIPDYQANIATAFAQGNAGRAITLATSGDFREKKESLIQLVRRIDGTDIYRLSDIVKELEIYQNDMYDYLDLMQVWYRDVLYYKATGSTRGFIFLDEAGEIKKQADKIGYEGLEQAFCAIETARARLRANGNFALTMELLLLEIKEIYKWQR